MKFQQSKQEIDGYMTYVYIIYVDDSSTNICRLHYLGHIHLPNCIPSVDTAHTRGTVCILCTNCLPKRV